MRLIRLVLGAFIGLAVAGAAQAVPIIPLSPVLTIGNVEYTATYCTYQITGTGSAGSVSTPTTATNCTAGLNLQMTQSGSGVIFTATAGTLDAASSTGGVSIADVTIKLVMRSLNGSLLSGVSAALVGASTNSTVGSGGTIKNSVNTGIGTIAINPVTTTALATFGSLVSYAEATIDSRITVTGVGSGSITSVSYSASTVPEPSTMFLMLVGGVGLALRRRRGFA